MSDPEIPEETAQATDHSSPGVSRRIGEASMAGAAYVPAYVERHAASPVVYLSRLKVS